MRIKCDAQVQQWAQCLAQAMESGFLRPRASTGHTSGDAMAANRDCAWLNGVYALEQGDSQPERRTVRSALRMPNGASDLVGGHQKLSEEMPSE